jgi:dTDP-4-dehydrorhamnose reductase
VTRILITGASGLLGINLALEASKRYEVLGATHDTHLDDPGFETIEADLLTPNVVDDVLDKTQPDWIINCAALANLDDCERQPDLAQRLNAELPGRLASEAAKRGLRFLQISTDAVFDGIKGNYDEEDSPAPLSVYGRTKRLAELAVKAAHPHVLVVRPNFFGWSVDGNRSLAEFFFNNLSAGKSVPGYTDRFFSPLVASDLAQFLLSLLEKDLRGIYHAGSADHMSKYQFGVAIANKFGLDATLINPTSTADTAAPRALNLSLRTARLSKALGRSTPTIAQGIEKMFEQFQLGYPTTLRSMTAIPVGAKG